MHSDIMELRFGLSRDSDSARKVRDTHVNLVVTSQASRALQSLFNRALQSAFSMDFLNAAQSSDFRPFL